MVFDWIRAGETPTELEIQIGANIPVDFSQAVIKACSENARIPLVLSIMSNDDYFGNTRRIYIGSHVSSGKGAIPEDKLIAVLKQGLTPREFAQLIASVPARQPRRSKD